MWVGLVCGSKVFTLRWVGLGWVGLGWVSRGWVGLKKLEQRTILPQFQDLLAVTPSTSLSLWAPLPRPFWCDPSFTLTFKAFHHQWGHSYPVMGPFRLFPPYRPRSGGSRVVCAGSVVVYYMESCMGIRTPPPDNFHRHSAEHIPQNSPGISPLDISSLTLCPYQLSVTARGLPAS